MYFVCFFTIPHHIYLHIYYNKLCFVHSDINECEGVNECDVNSECENTDGSYTCTCNPGYTGTGRICCES